jgi:hypothetical protein
MANHAPLSLKPRLKTSKKWTKLPEELLQQISSVCCENFKEEAKKGTFIANGQIYAEELLFQLGYLEKQRLRQINFNVSIQFDVKKENALQLIHIAIDCAGSLMANHFEEQGDESPTEWEKITIENKVLYHCFTTENSQLEAEADKWLGKLKDDLVGESEDAIDDDDLFDDTTETEAPTKPKSKTGKLH